MITSILDTFSNIFNTFVMYVTNFICKIYLKTNKKLTEQNTYNTYK